MSRAPDAEDTARALVAERRFAEAGELLVRALHAESRGAPDLDGRCRRLAQMAAVCIAQAGDPRRAAELALAAGDFARAADLLDRAGDLVAAARLRARVSGGAAPSAAGPFERQGEGSLRPFLRAGGAVSPSAAGALRLEEEGKLEAALEAYVALHRPADAGRVAFRLKRYAEAAQMFLEAGTMPYEAAAALLRAGAREAALEQMVRVSREDPRYRATCIEAVRVASELGTLDFRLDHFLTRFLQDPPRDDREVAAFEALAGLYLRHDYGEAARGVLEKVVQARPGRREAAERLGALDAEARGSPMVYERLAREDAAFFRADAASAPPARGQRSPRDLPDLPDLPPLPAAEAHGVKAEARAEARAQDARAEARTHMMPDAAPGIAPGQVFAGRYRIDALLGEGGMASVYRATDLVLGEPIAIKVFSPHLASRELLDRFKQELSVSRQLGHPNIVRVYDFGQHEGQSFITMELLAGKDLSRHIQGPMEPARALRYLYQACAGLHVAHERGIVHRDLKPENLFVTTEDVLKVMDFGIAKRSTQRVTMAGFVAGTPAYMSPEQITSFAAVTHATDLYALGVIAYELVTGRLPFQHEDVGTLLLLHRSAAPVPPRQLRPGLPPALERVILTLLDKDPARRIPTCRDLAARLLEIEGELHAPAA